MFHLVTRCAVGAVSAPVLMLALPTLGSAQTSGGVPLTTEPSGGVVPQAVKTTTPFRSVVSFALDTGQTSPPIKIPQSGTPVLLMVAVSSPNTAAATTQANLIRLKDDRIVWTGVNAGPPPSFTYGATATSGSVIVTLVSGYVEVQVNDANSIKVFSQAPAPVAGTVTLIW